MPKCIVYDCLELATNYVRWGESLRGYCVTPYCNEHYMRHSRCGDKYIESSEAEYVIELVMNI
jgi:hypothetical protein